MDGAHGNSPCQRAMAQRPEPLRCPPDTELAFFRRLLRKRERELVEISKKAYRKDHSSRSRETLEARSRTRETRQAIENIIRKMGNKSKEGRDRDGAPPATGGATRPHGSPAPTPPPGLPKPPRPTGTDITAVPPHREIKRRRIEAPKEDPEYSNRRRYAGSSPPRYPASTQADPRRHAWNASGSRRRRRHSHRYMKAKAPGRASARRRPSQGQPGR